jgi:predicted pyridoxine 5'-phosphate oxidase superfamily flavin-nucleotide-binding protein
VTAMWTSAHGVPSDVAFTPSVKAIQSRLGSRKSYARMEEGDGWATEVTEELAGFIAEQDSFFMATVNAEGQPYIQHRGGAKGFLRVLDPNTLAFADFRGNRQYVSMGNLVDSPKVHLFLIDYAHRQRIKIWGEAEVVEDDPALVAGLAVAGYAGRVERAIVIRVVAWDANCPQHIPQLLDARDVAAVIAERDARIVELERRLAAAMRR